MDEFERFSTSREATESTVGHRGPTPERYQTALERYLAAIAQTIEQRLPPTSDAAPFWRMDDVQVRDVMTSDVISVRDDAPYKEIVQALTVARVSSVPVVDDSGRAIGIVSESDLVARITAGGQSAGHLPGTHTERRDTRRKAQADTASGLMTAPAVTTGPHASIVVAARAAAEAHVRRLPVVDGNGVLIGIVTRSDLLRVFLRRDADIYQHIVDEVITRRFCADPASIDVTVHAGVVTLSGELERRGLIDTFVATVRAVVGVVSVRNQLTYRFDDSLLPPPRVLH